jgi:hypothetical protein
LADKAKNGEMGVDMQHAWHNTYACKILVGEAGGKKPLEKI